MRFMAVDCSHARNYEWSRALIGNTLANMPDAPFSAGDVATDYQLRGFCYWFYKRLRGYDSHGRNIYPVYNGLRTVVEMGNMKCVEQAKYLYEHPDVVGKALSRAIAHESITQEPDTEGEYDVTEEQYIDLMVALKHADKAASQNTYSTRIATLLMTKEYETAVAINAGFAQRWPGEQPMFSLDLTAEQLKALIEG